MRGTGFVVVGTGLLVVALVTGAVAAATVSVAIGAVCGAVAWRMGIGPPDGVGRRMPFGRRRSRA